MSIYNRKTPDQPPKRTAFRLPGPSMSILLLAWTAGCFDAISYLALSVFPANMTGNTVLLGIGIGTGQITPALDSAFALLTYCLGVLVAALITRYDEPHPWTLQRSIVLALETIAILLFALLQFYPRSTIHTPAMIALLIALASLAMGMQSIAARGFGVSGIATTYITGTLTTMVLHLAQWLSLAIGRKKYSHEPIDQTQQKVAIHGGVWLVYITGATTAAATETFIPSLAVLIPLAAIVLVLLNTTLHYKFHQYS